MNCLLLLGVTAFVAASGSLGYAILATRGRTRAEQALNISEKLLEKPLAALRARPAAQWEPAPPLWVSAQRKRYHLDLRDYHAKMVVEAGKAAREPGVLEPREV